MCDFRHSRGDNLYISAILINAFYNLTSHLRSEGGCSANSIDIRVDKYIDEVLGRVEDTKLVYNIKVNRVGSRAPAPIPITVLGPSSELHGI